MTTEFKNLVEEINSTIETFKTNLEKFTEKSNKAAGARARKATTTLAKLFKELRKQSIQITKN